MTRRSGAHPIGALSILSSLLAAAGCSADVPIGERETETASFPVTVHLAGDGNVKSSDGSIDCGAICSSTIAQGTTLTLTATPGTSGGFAGWSGACKGTATSCTITVNAATDITASFSGAVQTLSVKVGGSGQGIVTSNPKGISCGAQCDAPFPQGATVTLTPQAKPGSTFMGWTGACEGIGACLVKMDKNQAVEARFETSGVLWAKRFGSQNDDNATEQGNAVAVDGDGNVYLGAQIASWSLSGVSPVDFGGGPLSCVKFDANGSASPEGALAKFTPAGDHVWSKCVPYLDSTTVATNAASAGAAHVAVTGTCTGPVDFGDTVVPCSAGSSGGFPPIIQEHFVLASLSGQTGATEWTKLFQGDKTETASALTVDAAGNIIVTGGFSSSSLDLGGGPLVSSGSYTGFLAKYAADGTHLWSRTIGDGVGVTGIATLPNGDVVLAGGFFGTIDMGGGPLTSKGGQDIFLARYAGATGAFVWSAEIGGTDYDIAWNTVADANGDVFVVGQRDGFNAFAGKYAGGDGSEQWSKVFAETGVANDWSVIGAGIAPSGDLLFSVTNDQLSDPTYTIDFGGGPMTGPFFVVDLAADGSFHAAYGPGGAAVMGSMWGGAMAVDKLGHATVTGAFNGTVDFTTTKLTSALTPDGSASTDDIFLVQVTP